jgi:acyl-CoA reductase-like NAD-dependent aldehyde dehydrogenase
MTISASEAKAPVEHTDRFFIGGQWVAPSSDSTISVIDSHTEQVYLTVAEAQAADMDRAITAAKEAFDHGPWPRLTHAERAAYLRALGDEVVKRSGDIAQMWPRESGVIAAVAKGAAFGAKHTFDYYAAKGIEIGATLATGGGRPKDLGRGWYVEPTVFGNVDNSSVIAQEEIFGPVLSVIPADDEADAVRIANDTIYGLHGAVFTNDVDRAREVAGQIRTGAIGHNGFKSDFDMGHGGFKQSGIGREGGVDGLLPFLESKAMLLDGPTSRYSDVQL